VGFVLANPTKAIESVQQRCKEPGEEHRREYVFTPRVPSMAHGSESADAKKRRAFSKILGVLIEDACNSILQTKAA
jgi:hypothetical protein